MVIVTTRAKEALALIKESANVNDPTIGLRLEQGTADRYSLFPDRERPGDLIVEHQGARVLLIDDELSEILAGAKIDGKATDQGLELVIARAREEEGTGE